MKRVYLKQNVLEAGLERIRRIFDEFPRVLVCFSGGKDSTVIYNLALQVAEEKGRLPLDVFWLDQEAEWRNVVTYVRTVMNDPRVRPHWFQGHFRLTNSGTTDNDPWLHCWRDGDDWIRPKEPNSIHTNECGTDRFHDLFAAFALTYFGGEPCARIGGVRCEEAKVRLLGLTRVACYKDITWGSVGDRKKGHFLFYPLYDWSWTDVWKAIHDHGWPYCRLYDYMWQYGVDVRRMRVSNVHHEAAIGSLRFLQEIEPDTWDKIVKRVANVDAVSKVWEAYKCPEQLPRAFGSWHEYRAYLLDNVILVDSIRERFRAMFSGWDRAYGAADLQTQEDLMRHCIATLLINDYEGTLHRYFEAAYAGKNGKASKRARKIAAG